MDSLLIVAAIFIALVVVSGLTALYMWNLPPRSQDSAAAEPELDEEWRRVSEPDLAGFPMAQALDLRELDAGERAAYLEEWRRIQARVAEDPGRAMLEADRLAERLMHDRGYPIRSEVRWSSLAPEHTSLVQLYLTGHALAEGHRRERLTREELRLAMWNFRGLFAELLRQPAASNREAA